MTEFNCERTVVIQAPIQMVYGYVSDFSRHVEWNYQLAAMTQITDGPVGVGSIFRTKEKPARATPWLMKMVFPLLGKLMGGKGYTEATITVLETNKCVAWVSVAPSRKGDFLAKAEWEICLQSQSAGTRVTQRVHFHGLAKFFEGMDPKKLSEDTGEEMVANFTQLQAILEPQAEQQKGGNRTAFA
jgi:hypothetical protein